MVRGTLTKLSRYLAAPLNEQINIKIIVFIGGALAPAHGTHVGNPWYRWSAQFVWGEIEREKKDIPNYFLSKIIALNIGNTMFI